MSSFIVLPEGAELQMLYARREAAEREVKRLQEELDAAADKLWRIRLEIKEVHKKTGQRG